MINVLTKNINIFIVVVLLQVLIVDSFVVGGLYSMFIYPLFILLLPFDVRRYVLLILGFILGLTIDVFSDTPGMHASATLFMAYLRPEVLVLLSSREVYDSNTLPRISQYGFSWFLRYSSVLIFAHHLFLFAVESFSLSSLFDVLINTLISSILSLFLIGLSQFIIFRN